MDEMKADIQCRGMDIRKGRDVDVRNANEMRTVEEERPEEPYEEEDGRVAALISVSSFASRWHLQRG